MPVAGEMEESEGGKEGGGRASWKGKKMKERGRGRQKVRKMERGRRAVGAPGRWLLGPPLPPPVVGPVVERDGAWGSQGGCQGDR